MKLNPPWIALAALLFAGLAHADFGGEEARIVPVDRLIANQEARLTNQPADGATLYRLARLHALRATFGSIEMQAGTRDLNPIFAFSGTDTGIFQSNGPRLGDQY
jgi:hypothetical protein